MLVQASWLEQCWTAKMSWSISTPVSPGDQQTTNQHPILVPTCKTYLILVISNAECFSRENKHHSLHMWSVLLKAFLSWFVNDPGWRQFLLVDCEDVVFIQSWSSFLFWLSSNLRTFLLWVVLLNCCWHRKTGGCSLLFSVYKNNNDKT